MLSDGELTIDSAQLKLLEHLDLLHLNLLSESKRFFTKKNIKGIYIYGEVGRGKTKIMDIFFKSLKIKEKQRIHFHRFMKNIHDELKSLSGKKDPISILVKKLNKKYRVFCLDEFYVEDKREYATLIGLLKWPMLNVEKDDPLIGIKKSFTENFSNIWKGFFE